MGVFGPLRVCGGAGTVATSSAEAARGPLSHFAALATSSAEAARGPLRHFSTPVCSRTTHSDRCTFGPRSSSSPEPHATEGVFRASPSVRRGGYRRYIQRGSRQGAPKTLYSVRLFTQHTQWSVHVWAPLLLHPRAARDRGRVPGLSKCVEGRVPSLHPARKPPGGP